MYVLLVLFAVFIHVSSPILGSTTKTRSQSCSMNEITCSDGSCVSFNSLCDGINDCADGIDESLCNGGSSTADLLVGHVDKYRAKRQAGCQKFQWQCRDRTCISFDGKCDGIVDCPDASDETHPLCRKTQCQPNWFRCTYGACVDGTAPCNGVKECADNSDELLPRCRNETNESNSQSRCQDGTTIPVSSHCDGIPDCPDGSDETVRACAGITCPSYLFQCAYGACVDQGADCNGKKECADGSDESDELCNRILQPSGVTTTTKMPISTGTCVLPPYPEHGTYAVSNVPSAVPGQAFESLQLSVSCRPGYGVIESSVVFCLDGVWYGPMPQCERFCKLNPHPSVQYHCLVSGDVEGQRRCNEYEPTGTIVRPECNSPNYYSTYTLPSMRCINGSWNEVFTCIPGLIKNGTNITIIIKDKVEVYISGIEYASGNYQVSVDRVVDFINNTPSVVNKNGNKVNKSDIVNKMSTTESGKIVDSDYDISDLDWRIGMPQKEDTKLNFNIVNSSVVLNAKDKIYFRN